MQTEHNYRAPSLARIGHVHLKVSDLEKSIAFYRDLLGFELTMMYGDQAALLSAGGYHHHIGLNTWHSKNSPPADDRAVLPFPGTSSLLPVVLPRNEPVDLERKRKAQRRTVTASDE